MRRRARQNPEPEFFDFGDGNGPVPAHRHLNWCSGRSGGWVADTAFIDADSRVDEDALVFGNAKVFRSSLYSKARVWGNAIVTDTQLDDVVQIYGDAVITGKHGNRSWVEGDSVIHGRAVLGFGMYANIEMNGITTKPTLGAFLGKYWETR